MVLGIIDHSELPLLARFFASEIMESDGSIAMLREGNIPFTAVIVDEHCIRDRVINRVVVQDGKRPIALMLKLSKQIAHQLMGKAIGYNYSVQQQCGI